MSIGTIHLKTTSFQQGVMGTCKPDIDFERYDLILGKQFLTHGFSEIAYEYYQKCTAGEYLLEVRISLNATTEAPNITYHALVPKIGHGEAVRREVLLQN